MGKSNKKYTYDYVMEVFKKNNCQLLEHEYVNGKTKMQYRCSCGSIEKITFSKFINGQRCRQCSYIKTSNKKRFSLDYVKTYFESHGCEFLQDHYENCSSPIIYRCICGNISTTNFSNFKNGHRCSACVDLSGDNHPQWNPDREQIKRNHLFRARCAGLLRRSLKAANKRKCNRTHEILGYSPKELQLYIESHPNWHKVKNVVWHIDHVFPIKAFLDYGIVDLKIINCLENLRPCKKSENLKKSYKYSKEKFEKWLRHKNLCQ